MKKSPKTAWINLVIAASTIFSGAAIPSYAADNAIQVSNPPSEFIIGDPKFLDPKLTFTVIVTGSNEATIKIQFVDFVYGAEGKRDEVPVDSTPYSLAKVFEANSFERQYKPNSRGEKYTFDLIPKSQKIDQLYFGGIKVSMEGNKSGLQKGRGVSANAGSVISVVNVTPYGFAGTQDGAKLSAAEIESVSFRASSRTSVIDYLIPDLPGVVNSGPIEAKVTYKNYGELPTFVTPSWKFSTGPKPLATRGSSKSILIGGSSVSRTVITQAEISGTEELADVLPNFGIVDIETTIQSEIGGTKFDPVVNRSSVLIVQWKEPFFFIALAITFVWYVLRKRPAKPGQKRKEPSLFWLAVKALKKEIGKRWSNRPSKTGAANSSATKSGA